jgi:hypothetical protein
MPYKIGFGGNAGTGSWDEASATGTASANTWTQVTVTWTPSADRSSAVDFDSVLYIYQTDATARTVYIDGVRVVPGSSADDYEMSHWQIPAAAEDEPMVTTATVSGSALACLSQLNELSLSRHWIKPTMASPWYQYVVEDRDTYAAKSVTETVATTEGWETADIDRASIANVVPYSYAGGVTYTSDSYSAAKYGMRPAAMIDGSLFWSDATVPNAVGTAIVTRYKDPRIRPTLTRINVFPEMLVRDLSDVLSITVQRYGVLSARFAILATDLQVGEAGILWTKRVTLEEFPF